MKKMKFSVASLIIFPASFEKVNKMKFTVASLYLKEIVIVFNILEQKHFFGGKNDLYEFTLF
jgi:hypothetical protein